MLSYFTNVLNLESGGLTWHGVSPSRYLYAALTLNQGCESATTDIKTTHGASESDEVATDDGVSQTNDASVETTPTGLTEFSWREDEQELTAESLFEENVNAVWGLEGGRVLVQNGEQIILFDNGEWRAPLSTSVQISNIVRAADDTLLHTNEGLLVLRDGQITHRHLTKCIRNSERS